MHLRFGFACIAFLVSGASVSGILVTPNRRAGQAWIPGRTENYLGMPFVWFPPGGFLMGSPPDEEGGNSDQEAQHRVTLTKGFYLSVYLVTQEQWKAVMGSNPSRFKNEANLPVDSVSWYDCQEFIKRLRDKDARPYRLPTEAEWEYACRAGTSTPFYFGQTIGTHQANFNGNEVYGKGFIGVNRERTTPVGAFRSSWGLYDMHGNLWQWCEDWFDKLPTTPVVDPKGPREGRFRVLRGGSWYNPPSLCRSASRFRYFPEGGDNNVGLRVCFGVD